MSPEKRSLAQGAAEGGFTLVELLVVIVILSILAAIAIPVFFRQRDKGMEAQAHSALKNAATAMESWATNNEGEYPAPSVVPDPAVLVGEGFRPLGDVDVYIDSMPGNAYCLEAVHLVLLRTYRYSSAEGRPVVGICA